MAEPTHIEVVGARQHNLNDVDVVVPRKALVVFTGVSGSGKSSLAYDTIYQEGQRRFLESLSAYARQFLGALERPDVEAVSGVSPTLSIDQKTVHRNPRSTVGTVTELYDHLRLLMARLGELHCPSCGTTISKLSIDQVAEVLLEGWDLERVQVLGPVVRERKGEYRQEMAKLHQDGWLRARVDGSFIRLEEPPELARYEKHTLEVVVDRLTIQASDRGRLQEALTAAARLGAGVVTVVAASGEREVTFSTDRACPHHPEVALPEVEPRLFSFNVPQGACQECRGLGRVEAFDPGLLLDTSQPLGEAFKAFNDEGRLPFAKFDRGMLESLAEPLGGTLTKPISDWPKRAREKLLHGDPSLRYTAKIRRGSRTEVRDRVWRGLLPMVERVWHFSRLPSLARYRVVSRCASCEGERLNAIARAVTFRGTRLPEWVQLTVGEIRARFDGIRLEGEERLVGEQLLHEIRHRLAFLDEVGLSYLTLDRSVATLSGGEAQRIRLAAQVGSALEGVTYVLDEPSIGLHPRDNARLLDALFQLRDRGNTVLVVEHDAQTILAADWVVDVGPGAGRLGGDVVASCSTKAFLRSRKSVTAAYLRGELQIAMPEQRRNPKGEVRLEGARVHNLQDQDVVFPLGTLTVVTGVSGSGKSSLVFGVLEASYQAWSQHGGVVGCAKVSGFEQIDKLIPISQQPIGRTPRSNPATYTGLFTVIRELFAATPESRLRGYAKGRFSFNVEGGRCDACQGAGVKTVEMQFLPSVQVRCDVCNGRRFNEETLEVHWSGHSIHDVLEMTVAEALGTFSAIPRAQRVLQTMVDVGLEYVKLGQPSTTLSGGEAQRVKLATELHRPSKGSTLYLLDEPTTGLHFQDVGCLLQALQTLVDEGNTVVIIEHHEDVIKTADHLIDLGPEGGASGGRVVAKGTPEEVLKEDTATGRLLASLPEFQSAPAEPETTLASGSRRQRARGSRTLRVTGARQHNLADVSVQIPHGKLTVVTGPSGSGKTSLALDTIFAEGQRQYVESLSTYARRFLGRVERAPVDRLEGLQPAIAIEARNSGHNPRSTVATVTEVHDILRLLWSRVGIPHCTTCGEEVVGHAVSDVVTRLKEDVNASGWMLAPLRPAAVAAEGRRDALQAEGWARLCVIDDGQAPREVALDEPGSVEALASGAWLVLDRLNPARSSRARIAEAVEHGYKKGAGMVAFVERGKGGSTHVHRERPSCPVHGPVLEGELTPRHFSFNAHLGACERCGGLGQVRRLREDKMVVTPEAPLWEALDRRLVSLLRRSARTVALVHAVLALDDVSPDQPWRELPASTRDALMHGLGDLPIAIAWSQRWGSTNRQVSEDREWPGFVGLLNASGRPPDGLVMRVACDACGGGRLRAELQAVTVCGQSLPDFMRLTVREAIDVVEAWSFEGQEGEIVARPRLELIRRLTFLRDVGLGYLCLDRSARSLSGGEAQRIRLASQLGSGLTGTTYVLDEPTVGLHPRDTARLLDTLEGLRDLGNTVLLVEHDLDTIRRADHVIDLGPAAGRDGGRVMAQGSPAKIARSAKSVTGPWLQGTRRFPARDVRRSRRGQLAIEKPTVHNLRMPEVTLPTGVWVGVSGVSGSGKSSLILDTLRPAVEAHVRGEPKPDVCRRMVLDDEVNRVVVVNQSPIGGTPRSTPATYCKFFQVIRGLFAATPGARMRGWKPGWFSFNASKGGRCTICEGRGQILVEMHFLPDVWITCEACRGRRYDAQTLEVRWAGHSIADVLSMRIDEAVEVFANHGKVRRSLEALRDVGLGYLELGQPATTLSGGEAQRVKLASELTSRRGHALYLLDEPTTGLHPVDVEKLVGVLHRLVDAGHTVVTIEHHLDLLLQVDHLIDLGPEAGHEGGLVVAQGTPEEVAQTGTATGLSLRELAVRLT